MLLAIIVLFLLFLPPLFLFLKQRVTMSELPPGPDAWHIMRNLTEFAKQPHVAFKNLARVHGPLMSLRLGGQTVIVVSSSSMAQKFLRNHDQIFSGRFWPNVYYHVPKAAESSIAMSKECDETWRFLRRLSQDSIFSSKSIESSAGVREAKVRSMVKYLTCREGDVVELEELISAITYNLVSNVMVSQDMFDVNSKNDDQCQKTVKEVTAEIVEAVSALGLADLFPILRKLDFWSNKKGTEVYRKMVYLWEDTVKQRRRSSSSCKNNIAESKDFLDALIENGLPDDKICLILMEILIAGTDASVITIVWLMVELLRHRSILHKVRTEVAEAFQGDGQQVNEAVLTRSNYLHACIKETLRLHFPGPFLAPHRAIVTCKIDDYTIPKDSMVIINAWAIARDPDNWKDPTAFVPERFLTSEIGYMGTHFEYIPFGAGRRMCPGSKVAFKNIQLIVASLVHYFDWGLPNGRDTSEIDVRDKFNVHLTKQNPLILMVRRRRHRIE